MTGGFLTVVAILTVDVGHLSLVTSSTMQWTVASTAATPQVSERTVVDNEWQVLVNCHFLDTNKNCDVYKRTLDAAKALVDNVCGAALNYVDCLEEKCQTSNSLIISTTRIRDRCSETYTRQLTVTTVSTIPTAAVATPGSATDALNNEWWTLTSCSFKEPTETCAREKSTLEYSIVLGYEVCRNARKYLDCLEDRCQYSRSLTESVMKIRAHCSAVATKKLILGNVLSNPNIAEADSRPALTLLELLQIYTDN